jgi:hypothetical protein
MRSCSPSTAATGTGPTGTGPGAGADPGGGVRISTAAPAASAPISPISATSGCWLSARNTAIPVSNARNAATPTAGNMLVREDMTDS